MELTNTNVEYQPGQELTPQISVRILENSAEILGYLNLGISIPILPQFHKYILKDLDYYKAKALLLEKTLDASIFKNKTDNAAGMCLVYNDGSETLFFGFFGVYDHDAGRIGQLCDALISYAKEKGYKEIRGPINVPCFIFGWGFMVEGSRKDLFIGSPINPPIYQEVFYEKGFTLLFQEDRYEMPALRMDPHKDKKLISLGINSGNNEQDAFDTGEYPYVFLNPGKEGMQQCRDEFVDLNRRFMPPSAQITPRADQYVDSLIQFVFEFGAEWMMWIVREKATNEMIANGYVIPDPFSLNKKGELDSISFHAWVVHPGHRRQYLAMFMYGFTSIQAKDRKTPHFITKGSWPVGAENEANGAAARKMGGKKDRSHLILTMKLE